MLISSYYALQSVPNLSKCNLILRMCVHMCVCVELRTVDLTVKIKIE